VEPFNEGKVIMTTTFDSAPRSRRLALDVGTAVALAGAAVTFNVGGALHPNDSGAGDKVAQLHDMLLSSTWYPSHLGLLASFGLFTVAFFRLRGRLDLAPFTRRVVGVVTVVSALTTAAMVPHLLAPLGADSIADRQPNALSVLMTLVETLAAAPWALGVALLALVAGVAGDLGNRVGGMGVTLWALGVVAVSAWRRRQTAVPAH
jgi:hypothetical protein